MMLTKYWYYKYMHAHHVPHVEHVFTRVSKQSESCSEVSPLQCCAVLCPSCSWVSEQSESLNAQVVSCHHYFVVFHPIVEQLTVSRRIL